VEAPLAVKLAGLLGAGKLEGRWGLFGSFRWLAVNLVMGSVADEAVDEAVESRVPDLPPVLVRDAELAREVAAPAAGARGRERHPGARSLGEVRL
jgi:hypothetical protein